jgi:hypothetical protein
LKPWCAAPASITSGQSWNGSSEQSAAGAIGGSFTADIEIMAMSIERNIQDLHGLSKSTAEQLGDWILDHLVEALQHDPALPVRTVLIWSVALANARQRIVEHIHEVIDDHVARDDVLVELRDYDLLDEECD